MFQVICNHVSVDKILGFPVNFCLEVVDGELKIVFPWGYCNKMW